MMVTETICPQSFEFLVVKLIEKTLCRFRLSPVAGHHMHDDFTWVINALGFAIINHDLGLQPCVLVSSFAGFPFLETFLFVKRLLLVIRVQMDVFALAPIGFHLFHFLNGRKQRESFLCHHSLHMFMVRIQHPFLCIRPSGEGRVDHVSEVVELN